MAYSVNWITKLITIPLSDLVWSIGNTYELALSDFHKEVRRLEAAISEGLWAPQILDHTSPKTISGVTYAAFDEIINGYTLQFAGNPDAVILKGSNNNILDVYIFNGVSVAPNNSTGLQDLSTMLASAYQGQVCVNFSTGQAGTSVPIGTRSRPSNNWVDAQAIFHSLGINRIQCLDSVIIDSTAQYEGHEFQCDNPLKHVITILPDAGVQGCVFRNANLNGTLDGDNVVRDCAVTNLVAISGVMHNSAITGTVNVESGGQLTMLNCHSGVAGGGAGQTAELDMNGDGSLRNSAYTGGLNMINVTDGGDISMDVQGRVIIESSCTGGDIYVRGDCWITDNSGAGCTVHDQTMNKMVNELWNMTGLDPDDAMVIGNGKYISTELDISVIDNGNGSYTLSRN